MFVVFALFNLFVSAGKPLPAVFPLFLATIRVSALLGELVARLYSEPLNHGIRSRWRGHMDQSVGKNDAFAVRESVQETKGPS
jgi:hypothetical protein